MNKVMVLLGSARKGRAADNVIKQLQVELDKHTDIEWEVVDPVTLDLPFFDEPNSPMAIDNGRAEYENPKGKAWAEKVEGFDGYILVTPEYNHGYSAILKNALDWAGAKRWRGKPVAFISYGAVSGGIRAVEQLRQVVLELRMHPLHDAVHLPHVYAAFNEEGEWNEENKGRQDAFVPMITELKDYLEVPVAVSVA